MTNRDREYNAFTPKTLGAIASSLSMLRPPDVRQSFPVKAHQDAASAAPPDPQLRYLRNQVGGTCGFWQSLAVFLQLLQTRLFWTLLRL